MIKNAEKKKKKRREANRISYHKHKEKHLLAKKKYKEANKEKIKLYSKEYSKKNPYSVVRARNPERYWGYKLKASYGITLDKFKMMLEMQNNKCAICLVILDKPHVDHCHKTGKIRSLLCGNCNLGIGQFKESIENLELAKQYLLKWSDK